MKQNTKGKRKMRKEILKLCLGGLMLTATVGICGCGSDGGNMASGQYESGTESINASGIECDAAADYKPEPQADMQSNVSTEVQESSPENVMETNIASIQITNGNTGEVMEISRDSQSEAFWEMVEKYEALDVKKSENQTAWLGYTYWLRLYDEEGQELHSVFPKGHYVEIDSIRFEDFETTTAVELSLAVDSLWTEDLPQAQLWETDLQETENMDGFTMEVTYVTPRGICLQMTNNSELNILFGESYSIQTLKEGQWYEVGYLIDNWAFNSIGYQMAPHSARSWWTNWGVFHGELSSGTYRIVKDISDFRGTGDFTKYYIAAEFNVD